MYHYVRNNEDHQYDFYCRRVEEFEAQVDFYKQRGEIIDPFDIEKLRYFIEKDNTKAFLLSFDDGYIDHFYCAEYLNSENIKGIFFPPINSINGELLDVNAIHILLGLRNLSKTKLLGEIKKICLDMKIRANLQGKLVSIDNYINLFEEVSPIHIKDKKINLIIKRLLQRDIESQNSRKNICNLLIKKFTLKNANKLSKEIYLTKSQMIQMRNMGMSFGSHGLKHRWLGTLSFKEQYEEIKRSFSCLKELSLISDMDPRVMCYPYGSYNNDSLKILSDLNIDYCLTTKSGEATSTSLNKLYELHRWDTNSFWDSETKKPILPI